jgi:hypothetical protein
MDSWILSRQLPDFISTHEAFGNNLSDFLNIIVILDFQGLDVFNYLSCRLIELGDRSIQNFLKLIIDSGLESVQDKVNTF